MRSLYLATARFCVTAWVGGAVLFVVTGVREVTSENTIISSEVKDALVPIRFNAYYLSGFLLLAVSTLCCGLYLKHRLGRSKRLGVCLGLLVLALITMIVDYLAIYLPLVAMVTPPGGVKPARFETFHNASMTINAFMLGLCLAASVLLCLPMKLRTV